MQETKSEIQSGSCPKCGGGDIRFQHAKWGHRNALPTTIWGRGAMLDNYVCTHCGYVESYVQRKDIELVIKRWEPLRPESTT